MGEGRRCGAMSLLQIPDTLYDSNVLMALSPTAHKLFWLACRKHQKFWTDKKKFVIFGLSKAEIISLGIGHNQIAPSLRELQAAGLIVLVQAGYGGAGIREGVVSQYRVAFLDVGRHAFDQERTIDEWKEIFAKARECSEKPKPKSNAFGSLQGPEIGTHVRGPKTGTSSQNQGPETGTLTPGPRNRDSYISTSIYRGEPPPAGEGVEGHAARPIERATGKPPRRRRRQWLVEAYGSEEALAAARRRKAAE